MTLLFDLSAVQPLGSKPHGGSEYARSVFLRLLELSDGRPLSACYDAGRHLEPDVRAAVEAHGVELLEINDNADLQVLIDSGRFERFMAPLPYAYHDMDFSNVELVMTIHGLRPLEMPADSMEWRYVSGAADTLKWLVKFLLKGRYVAWRRGQFARLLQVKSRKTTVVVVSEHTRRMVLKWFPETDPADVKMLHSPETIISRVEPAAPSRVVDAGLEPGRYILMVSGGQWVKNVARGLEAIIPLLENHPVAKGMKVALVSGAPRRLPASWRRHIVLLDRLDADELARFYAEAFCLLYPSLNEGFGYPPLECMARGTPVLSSSSSSIPEVLDDAALFFPPRSVPEMREALKRLLDDDALRTDLIERGRHRYELIAERQSAMLDELCRLFLET